MSNYCNMKELIIISTLVILILIFAYIKIKYPFWNMLPVYHIYDIGPLIYKTPYIVNKTHRPNTKYYQSLNVETMNYNDLEQEHICDITKLLHSNYIQDDKLLYEVNETVLDNIYKVNEVPSNISLYRSQEFNYNNNKLCISKIDYIQGMIGSVGVIMKIYDGSQYNIYNIHKITHFCCHQNEDKNTLINRKLLCSHFHNVLTYSHQENDTVNEVTGFLFSKELEPHTGIVPFISYTIQCYQISQSVPMKMNSGYFISELSKNNVHRVSEYIENRVNMNYQVLESVYTIRDNLRYKIYLHSYKDNIIGLYIFQDKRIYCERSQGYIIDCVCSHNNMNYILDAGEPDEIKKNEIVFTIGFNEVINTLKKQNFSKINIHNLGHNNQIIKHWIGAVERYQSYLYLYNIIVPSSPIQGCEYFSMS